MKSEAKENDKNKKLIGNSQKGVNENSIFIKMINSKDYIIKSLKDERYFDLYNYNDDLINSDINLIMMIKELNKLFDGDEKMKIKIKKEEELFK